MRMRTTLGAVTVGFSLLTCAGVAAAQERITAPKTAFGFAIGDDYQLATYTQLQAYWTTLARESRRMIVEEIGRTAEGRPQLMAIITSPENHRSLGRYKEIAGRLAKAEGLTEAQARSLAREGKAVVWIDGGLHATEVLGAHQLMETVYQLVSATDQETLRFLNDVIVLAVHANPDGMELVSEWYMREAEPTRRSTSGIPRLYQKYVGHDNNRDFYMVTQAETENMTRIMFHEWFPQIVYNHHQTGPAGTVLFAPPFRDPFNYNYDPLIPLSIEGVGAAMHMRFVAEGKPGSTMRSGASYSTWWNGGLRTVTYFHNMIGLLTETIGNPTPIDIPFIVNRQLPSNDLPFPIEPQRWHFRQSVDYSVTANKAVLDYASRHREVLLYNIYLMGKNSIDRGNRDHWTPRPSRLAAIEAASTGGDAASGGSSRRRALPTAEFAKLRRPEDRDPRGYVLSAAQRDFSTATKFVNALVKNGVTVLRATREFTVDGRRYPAGSFVIKAAQAFRPHVLDMFEPQDHPNDFEYAGGPPIAPYDNAGWTLAYLMGVEFDRVLDGFDGPFERVTGLAAPLPGRVTNAAGASGFLLNHAVNDAAIVTNRVLKAGGEVYWIAGAFTADGREYPAGTIYVRASREVTPMLEAAARELGVSAAGVRSMPQGRAIKLRPVRVALWDRYGGSMPSGWTRWLLEQYEFPFDVVYPSNLDRDDLQRYSAIVFPDGAIPAARGEERGGFGGPPSADRVPPEYRHMLGSVSVERTVPRLIEYVRGGGTIVAIGSSTSIGAHAGLPIANHLVDGSGRQLRREDYYIPGSVLRVRLDTARPVAYGMPADVDVFFNNSEVFRLTGTTGVLAVGTFTTAAPLRSGWAWGQERLKDGVAMVEASVGSGHMYLFGPEILNRGQPHGTFKLFFNSVFLGAAER